ncbi:patatin family protein [Vibrio sp. ZSDZ34]|uniref:Patatin family protein n=2 Tax=Vibrio gelatinilyticus TaxID=2893468 RepID=A0A9X2AWN4_9VIBR|nr:patatin family protein [Vibrio gelatinilyticus]MCJ2377486.1 patatin family protein [Vibrio gelatinilyticus]
MVAEDTSHRKHALVVEGGAMRGIFSAGVLDGFIDRHYRPFDFCIGVSSGSTSLASWLANQRERTYDIITHYSCSPKFINFRRFAMGGHWLDLDWLWDILAQEHRFDMDAFTAQSMPFYIVTTEIESGRAAYIHANSENIEQALKASCSVPIAYRDYPVLDNIAMTDGGIADSIPVCKAYEMGANEITVILSRPLGYRKKVTKAPWLIRRAFKEQPHLAQAMLERAERYNSAIDFISNPPLDCKVNVIAPPKHFAVGRLTTDQTKLHDGYNMGLALANVNQLSPK